MLLLVMEQFLSREERERKGGEGEMDRLSSSPLCTHMHMGRGGRGVREERDVFKRERKRGRECLSPSFLFSLFY